MSEFFFFFFVGTYFCLFVFFSITCINSLRSFRHMKKYSQEALDSNKNASEKTQKLYGEYTGAVKQFSSSVEDLEKKIDEIRIQVGIINGRMGDYGRVITVPSPIALESVSEKGKGGWPKGKPRKSKQIEGPAHS